MAKLERQMLLMGVACVALLFAAAFVYRATTYPYSGPVSATRIGADVTREEAERDPNAALARLSSYGGDDRPGFASAHPSSVTGKLLSVDWEARTLTLEVRLMFTRPTDVMGGLNVNLGFDADQKAEVEAALAAGGEWSVLYFSGTEPNTFSIYSLSPAKDYDSSPAIDTPEE